MSFCWDAVEDEHFSLLADAALGTPNFIAKDRTVMLVRHVTFNLYGSGGNICRDGSG
jgi:hypothetical protein